ncbi:MAG: hypothetical protein ACR2FE_08805 [Aeromicrobium sp.]
MRPAQGPFPAHPRGDVWAYKGEGDAEAHVSIDYGGTALDVPLSDVRPLRDALDQLLAILDTPAT